jgi:transposase
MMRPRQKQIRHFCQKDPELRQSVAWLKSLPGIGEIIATHLVARLGDPSLITKVRQIAGFLGLVSSEHSTGDKQNRGKITRAGDSRLRNKLIQSAWVTIRCTLAQFARQEDTLQLGGTFRC